jgi:hypothetical protein
MRLSYFLIGSHRSYLLREGEAASGYPGVAGGVDDETTACASEAALKISPYRLTPQATMRIAALAQNRFNAEPPPQGNRPHLCATFLCPVRAGLVFLTV